MNTLKVLRKEDNMKGLIMYCSIMEKAKLYGTINREYM